jgi:hypothetical protein
MVPRDWDAVAGPHEFGGGMQGILRQAVRRFWLAASVAGILIAPLAQAAAQPAPTENALVLAADQALADAMRSGDRSIARQLLSLQFTFTDENGTILERKEFIADLKGVAAAPAANVSVKIYGLVAMITGERKTVHGSDAFFLDIWVQQKRTWRALAMQDVVLAEAVAPASAPASPAPPYECKNPCQTIPYRVRSPAEQDVITAFQAVEKAAVAHDAADWAKHVADGFVLYGSGRAPTRKSDRIAAIERQKENNKVVTVGEIESMRLAVYGDGAAMIATHVMPDNSRPPYRAARVWVKRNGQWQMAISVQTDIKNKSP